MGRKEHKKRRHRRKEKPSPKRKEPQKRREKKDTLKGLRYGILATALILSLLCGGYLLYSISRPSNAPSPTPNPLSPTPNGSVDQTLGGKAAIVDHLSISQPNQTFVQKSTDILKTAGFKVDYYSSENVTVDFYRSLPSLGHNLIVFRVHTAWTTTKGSEVEYISFFTSELYSPAKYWKLQWNQQLVSVRIFEDSPSYFGVNPKFFKECAEGRFNNTMIIVMGCLGLRYGKMAEALVEKGAKVYVSWDGLVMAAYTDHATTRLLQHLATEKKTVKRAVDETMREVGPDPAYGSKLSYYPNKAGDYAIPDIKSSLMAVTAILTGHRSRKH